ncbi:helix-turn-helix domain-containing protein [Shouchella hunanensis]|uniref:Helix-turn-helix domain-containing protein n=1 Tax=Shouchella hunanensis TaxID=766894 RepID=A0ABY7W7F9_9BACI|nr:helix-turn-helix domain-containing protein [Shouchella hunanensis]WDF03446.1 helix-turn-helix domain-containing protein [Shouchella hunanensis]
MGNEHELRKAGRAFMKAQGLDQILHILTSAVATVIQDTDMVLIYTYDKKSHVLRLKSSMGNHSPQLYQVAFSPGESITGSVYNEQTPVLFLKPTEVEQAMSNISDINRKYYLEGVAYQTVYTSMSIPIILHGECFATITVNRCQPLSSFTLQDLYLVSELLEYALIALEKEEKFEHHKRKLHTYTLKQEAKNYFYQVLHEGGNQDRIVQLLSRLLQDRSVHYNENVIEGYASFPIKSHYSHRGWLLMKQQPNVEELYYIEEAANAIGILMVYDEKHLTTKLAKEEERFKSVLANNQFDEDFWRMNSTTPVTSVVLKKQEQDLFSHHQTIQSLLPSFSKQWKLISYDQFWILFFEKEQTIQETLLSKLVKSDSDKLGISRVAPVALYKQLFQEAMNAWALAERGEINRYPTLGLDRLLTQIEGTHRRSFIYDHLGTLREYPILLETLKMFIHQNRNRKETADALYIHPNTLYQRLKKIEDLSYKSIEVEEDWLNLVAAVKLCKL